MQPVDMSTPRAPSILLLSTNAVLDPTAEGDVEFIVGDFDFLSPNLPKYAILSHTWLPNSQNGVEEVVYADITSPISRRQLRRGQLKQAGFYKLRGLCNTAKHEGYQYVWMDTCCIDKSSWSHTKMAINNMQHYYKRATVCYAYLEDVSLPKIENARWPEGGLHETSSRVPVEFRRKVERARWFTRVWTLQELMAPSLLQLRDKNWNLIGTKLRWSTAIYKATGLQAHHLKGLDQDEAMAQKFHWASKRKVLMQEDEAYGLLGLFDIKFKFIHGESLGAFYRLQKMLIRRGESKVDSTILGWRGKSKAPCYLWRCSINH